MARFKLCTEILDTHLEPWVHLAYLCGAYGTPDNEEQDERMAALIRWLDERGTPYHFEWSEDREPADDLGPKPAEVTYFIVVPEEDASLALLFHNESLRGRIV